MFTLSAYCLSAVKNNILNNEIKNSYTTLQ